MKQAKLGIIFVVAIMALAAAGAGYAMWSQTLTITGTINTGEFAIGVRDDGTGDPGWHFSPSGDSGLLYPDGQFPSVRTFDDLGGETGTWDMNYVEFANNDEGKNIGMTESVNIGEPIFTHEDIYYYDSVAESVDNAYPYYMSYIAITFANGGTVPAKILSGGWYDIVDNDGLLPFLMVEDVYIVKNLHTSPEWYEITDIGLDNFQYQLDPCDTVTLVIRFYFEETIQGDLLMPELASASFTYELVWAQWNEIDQGVTPLGEIDMEPDWFNYVTPETPIAE